MYAACDTFTKSSVAKSCRNFETQDYPGGAQEGAFTTRLNRIAQAGGNCSGVTGVSSSTSGGALTTPGGFNLPMLLLIAGGAYLLMKAL